jgi:spore maturation protein CgeB
MKILIYGNIWNGSIEQSYARAFKTIGWEVECFDPCKDQALVHSSSNLSLWQRIKRKADRGFLKTMRVNSSNAEFVQLAESIKPQLILVVKGTELKAEYLSQLKKSTSCSVFVYHPDHPFISSAQEWNQNVLECFPIVDCHLVFGKFLIPIFKDHGARRVEYIPFGYDPELISGQVSPRNEYDCEIAFAGTWDKEREHWLSLLVDHFDVRLWGNCWESCQNEKLLDRWNRKALYGAEFAQLCRQAKLSFNFVRTENNRSSHNMRTFEIPACGGLALVNQTEEQLAFFKENEEMIFFQSESDLITKVRSVLQNAERIPQLKANALKASKGHAYQSRAKAIGALIS